MSGNHISVVNPANGVTLLRMLFFGPFWYCVHHGLYQWALVMIAVAGLLDKVDGVAARVFDCRSQFGEVFDAIADGVLYGACFVVLAVYGWIPAWPVFALVGLGGINTVNRFRYARRLGRAANFHSWAMERFVGYSAFLIAFGVAQYEVMYFYQIGVVAMAVVVLHDAKRMLLDPLPQ